ncbi:hypothetical protein ACJZTR_00460 [Neorickettsia risticii]|uniref:Macro domain-containing protein n=1 Tax=Neorickettsia risticii (strain Illinois) TaxID=434131 RepID=C6V3Z3_NEORI|nr:hypothetical protein [Neorickettsia risticii]ACT69110.1 conserved hypothetical protein [Neorickettsia risticii str. Illinois]
MGTNEKIWIACGVVAFLLFLGLAAGLYWLCKVAARQPVDAALEEVKITGLVPGVEGVLFSSDELLGPAGATEPTWDSDVVILDTSLSVLSSEAYPFVGEQGPLYRALGVAGREIKQSVKQKIASQGVSVGAESFTSSGMNCVLVHVCPSGLHDHDVTADPGTAVRNALMGAAQALFSEEIVRCIEDMRRDWTPAGREIIVLVHLPFSGVHSAVMSREEQARYFAKCMIGIPVVDVCKQLGVKVKVCCGGKELQAVCAEAAYEAMAELQGEEAQTR